MVNIRKRSGDTQKFDRAKLKNSIKKAGANEYDAEKVTSTIEKRVIDGSDTNQIREWVYIELKSIPDSWNIAEDYKSYRKQEEMKPMQ